jgi:hypothetical protein
VEGFLSERASGRGSAITNESRHVQTFFYQTPIDPAHNFNRDHDRVGNIKIKPCSKKFNQGLVVKW